MKQEVRYHYPIYSFRIGEEIMKKLKEAKKNSGKSWNLFFRDLLKELESKNV